MPLLASSWAAMIRLAIESLELVGALACISFIVFLKRTYRFPAWKVDAGSLELLGFVIFAFFRLVNAGLFRFFAVMLCAGFLGDVTAFRGGSLDGGMVP